MNIDNMTFEQAMEQLSKIVSQLENGELGLDASMALYSDAVKLLNHCDTSLKRAKLTLDEFELQTGDEE